MEQRKRGKKGRARGASPATRNRKGVARTNGAHSNESYEKRLLRWGRGVVYSVTDHPLTAVSCVWGSIAVALFAYACAAADIATVQKWTAENVEFWVRTDRGFAWRALTPAVEGMSAADLTAMTKEDIEARVAVTCKAFSNDWRDDWKATRHGTRVPRMWTSRSVRRWCRTPKHDTFSKWLYLGDAFDEGRGRTIGNIDDLESSCTRRLAATGRCMYDRWRAFVASRSVLGLATATLQEPWVAASLWLVYVASVAFFLRFGFAFLFRFGLLATKLGAFGNALRRIAGAPLPAAGSVVDFGVPTLDGHNRFRGPRKVFMRDCYVPLINEFVDDDVATKRRRVVIGNPGIGKSTLRLFVACKALAEGFDVAFLKYGWGSNIESAYIVSADGRHDRVVRGEEQVQALYSGESDSSVLVAAVAEDPFRVFGDLPPARWWYFTPPGPPGRERADMSAFELLWLPMWELAELQAAAQGLKLQLKHKRRHMLLDSDDEVGLLLPDDCDANRMRERIVRVRCDQFGGIARVVLAEDDAILKDHKSRVEEALHRVIKAGEHHLVSTLFDIPVTSVRLAYALVGIATRFDETGLSVRERYKLLERRHGEKREAFPDEVGRSFLQTPVDWLSRPVRELARGRAQRRREQLSAAWPGWS